MTAADLKGADLSGITGLHFHTLCEQGADTLDRTLDQVEAQFGDLLHEMEWLNMGGGHHITQPDYDRALLIRRIAEIRERYDLRVILEPGEAVAQEAGYLVSTVLDVFESENQRHAILDVSATAHMPDVLEMPYRPEILGGAPPAESDDSYLLGGNTCLAGDRIGVYSFDHKLEIGETLVFTDMAIYSMVKTTLFNGVQHPALALWDREIDSVEVTRTFGYADFRNRVG